MPLSEHEQRQFEAIERALYAEDPKFRSAVRRRDPAVAGRRRLLLAGLGFGLGLAGLLTGVLARLWYVGAVGFVVLLASLLLAAYSLRSMTGHTSLPRGARTGRADDVTVLAQRRRARRATRGTSGSLSARLEARWQRRMERGGF